LQERPEMDDFEEAKMVLKGQIVLRKNLGKSF